MNVLQLTKRKFKPVLDFREVNNHVLSHIGGGSKIDMFRNIKREVFE